MNGEIREGERSLSSSLVLRREGLFPSPYFIFFLVLKVDR